MRILRRTTARVLPVDTEGRVLLLHGCDPARPEHQFWFTIGGAVEPGETIETSPTEFSWAGMHFVQDQTFYAIAVPDATVSFAGQEALERSTIDKYGWLRPEDLGRGDERPADPELPRLMRLAVAAVGG